MNASIAGGRALLRRLPRDRGFTLVELMVTTLLTLGASIGIFAMARQGMRAFATEVRSGEVTLDGVTGMERLTMDLQRAGLLVTPNIQADPHFCGDRGGLGTVDLARLGAVRVSTVNVMGVPTSALVLAGAFDANEQFAVESIQREGSSGVKVVLKRSAALARVLERGIPLSRVFQRGRLLRIVAPDNGMEQYGLIDSAPSTVQASTTNPEITLKNSNPALEVRFRPEGWACGVGGLGTGLLVNPVNLVRYRVESLHGDPNYAAALYAPALTSGGLPTDTAGNRFELVRSELDPLQTDTPFAGTNELVAEYAVRFDVGVLAEIDMANANNTTTPRVPTYLEADDAADRFAPVTTVSLTGSSGPQQLRGLRATLTLRSRDADLAADLAGLGTRVQVGTNGPFARTKTFTTDVALTNLIGVNWQ